MKENMNRFAALSGTWKGKGLLLLLFVIFLFLVEVVCYGALVGYYKLFGRSLDSINSQIAIGRMFVANPVEENTEATYVGHLGDIKTKRRWHVADPILGWRLGRNVGVTYHFGYAEGLGWSVSNPQGFSVAGKLSFDVMFKKKSGVYRIFIIGGSSVEGYGVLNPLENLPSQFAKWLEKSGKIPEGYSKFEVINAGVSGYNSAQEFLYFITELAGYEPDLVIFYDGWNELEFWKNKFDKFPDYHYPKRITTHALNFDRLNMTYTLSGSASMLFKNSVQYIYDVMYRLASTFIVNRLMQKAFGDEKFSFSRVGTIIGGKERSDEFYRKTVLFYEKNIRDSVSWAVAKNIKIAYFLQPLVGVDGKEYYGLEKEWVEANPNEIKLRKAFYKKARVMIEKLKTSFANKRNVCVEDLSTSLKNITKRVYSDSGHLNALGNEYLSINMINKISECRMLDVQGGT